jgi:hypothetical protein
VVRIGDRRTAYSVLVGGLEGRRPLVTPRRRLEDNIRIDLKDIVWEFMDWIDLTEDRDKWQAFVNMVMYLSVP